MALEVGLRVVRGPDWKWDMQDDGEGHVGTIVEIGKIGNPHCPEKTVVVQWDSGSRTNYRAGYQKSYDLRVFDNAPVGNKHFNIVCNSCDKQGICGIRWKCSTCFDFDLCSECFHGDKHELEHEFIRFENPLSLGIPVPMRRGFTKIRAKGIFAGAEVVRGHDWDWEDQDGGEGQIGKVVDITGWEQESGRSVANVTWPSGCINIYRVGHKGKMDLKYLREASGGFYYREHLPVLGILPAQTDTKGHAHSTIGDSSRFSIGDHVKIHSNVETLRRLQVGHGEWNPLMAECIGKIGRIHRITERGDIRVQFEGLANRWTFNPEALTKSASFNAGDTVHLIEDLHTFRDLQRGHGEFVENMKSCLGKFGTVMKIYADGDLRVLVNGQTWTLNPSCLKTITDNQSELNNTMDSHTREEHINPLMTHFLTSTNEPECSTQAATVAIQHEELVRNAALGKTDAVLEYISRHADRVNYKSSCKTALQVACHQGHQDIVNILLKFQADIEACDEDGDTALHYAAFGDQPKIIEMLLSAGAKINVQNKTKCTALHVAVNKQFPDCVKTLIFAGSGTIKLPSVLNVNIQDSYGDTALHDAISKDNVDIISCLIRVPGVDFNLRNNRGFNVLHHAALKGNVFALTELLACTRQIVDLKKDDGFAALHLAALNGHTTAVELLLENGRCNPDVRNNRQQTPLLLAVSQAHEEIIVKLIDAGADINVQDEDGDTPLHVALIKRSTLKSTVMEENIPPKMTQIVNLIVANFPNVVLDKGLLIACFLTSEGCDLYKENQSKKTPLSLTGLSEIEDILKFCSNHRNHSDNQHSECLSESSEERKDCEICLESTAVVHFIPCGHRITCEECSLRMKKCLRCQTTIQTKIHSFTGEEVCLRKRHESVERMRQLESRLQEMEESSLCSICMERRRNVAFLCGHAACSRCAHPLRICHMCRKPITRRIQLYL